MNELRYHQAFFILHMPELNSCLKLVADAHSAVSVTRFMEYYKMYLKQYIYQSGSGILSELYVAF